jgi:hypothetical protein
VTFTNTEYKYVQLDENNVPVIAGTTMKLVELVTSVMAYGWSPEERLTQKCDRQILPGKEQYP